MNRPPLSVGVRLGDYHLLDKIAQGGMGTIYLAKRLGVGGFEKTFVIKCMLDSLADDQEAQAMFIDEARLAALLAHPNIAQIFDFGVIDGTYYIAMEHIPGEDLRAIINRLRDRKAKIPVPIALRIMKDLCAGLDYAHTYAEAGKWMGIIHRDISPANIMVSYHGTVKLLDFGIAKATSRISATRSGGLKGKLGFLSPEQIGGTPLDARADVFCLGITFYLLVANQHPWRRDSEAAVMQAIALDPLPDPRTFRDNIPADVAAILTRALERDRDRRFRSAAEMGEAIQQAINRIAPGVGASDVVTFMLALFGQEARDVRSNIPNLTESTPTAMLRQRPSASMRALDDGVDTAPDDGHGGPTTLEMPIYTGPPPTRPRLPWVLGTAAVVLAASVSWISARHRDPAPVVVAAPAPVAIVAPAPPPIVKPAPVAVAVAAPAPLPPVAALAPEAPPVPTDPPPKLPAPLPRPRLRRSVSEKIVSLDQKTLETVVKAAHPRLTACLRRYSAELPTAEGKIIVEVTVVASGRVSAAHAMMPQIHSSGLAACLSKQATSLRFPRHADKALTFRFPLVFKKAS